jgi:hypothetical protein
MENQNDIRGLLQDQFQHFEAEPPVDLWPAIESELGGNSRKRPLWLPYVAIAASAVILIGLWQLLSLDGPIQTVDPIVQEEIAPPVSVPKEIAPENLAEMSPVEDTLPATEGETTSPPEQTPTVSYQVKPLYAANGDKTPDPVVPDEGSTGKDGETEQTDDPKKNEVVINPLKQIAAANPEQEIGQLPTEQLVSVAQEGSGQEVGSPTEQMRKIKNNKLDLNDFSLQNVVSFASNEISKWAKSPLDYEHEVGDDAERKKYAIELGSFKITRTSYRKTINP